MKSLFLLKDVYCLSWKSYINEEASLIIYRGIMTFPVFIRDLSLGKLTNLGYSTSMLGIVGKWNTTQIFLGKDKLRCFLIFLLTIKI